MWSSSYGQVEVVSVHHLEHGQLQRHARVLQQHAPCPFVNQPSLPPPRLCLGWLAGCPYLYGVVSDGAVSLLDGLPEQRAGQVLERPLPGGALGVRVQRHRVDHVRVQQTQGPDNNHTTMTVSPSTDCPHGCWWLVPLLPVLCRGVTGVCVLLEVPVHGVSDQVGGAALGQLRQHLPLHVPQSRAHALVTTASQRLVTSHTHSRPNRQTEPPSLMIKVLPAGLPLVLLLLCCM